ncbi:MAG TPA: C25 family cysteine peptidase, partial [Chryseosolibacter sp.]
PVKAFAEYRALPEGGGFDTLIMNIDQLYDQFNYGEASPRAVYQFMKFFASVKLPDYLFLVGKGLDVNYGYRRNPSAFTVYKDLVPSAGYPASDMAYTIGLGSNENVHAVATGRLTANTAGEVASYLNKVKEREALPFNDLTRKKMLHLSGGIEEHEPALFRNIMAGFESVAEDLYLGGNVQSMAKQSTDIKLINIAEEVNNGLGLITFFGHSAPTTLDFDIGLVTDPIMGYNNTGKYPFLLMNGCDAGSFFLNTSIMGENWIQTPDKGAIGFIAHSSYGLVQGLQRYSSIFYNVAFGDSVFIKQGIGKVQQEVSRRYVENFGNSAFALSQSQQMVLLGDPAVRIFGAEKPDYSPDQDKIAISSYNGEAITALTDSFQIRIPVRNFGIAKEERLRIQVIREFNGGQTIHYDTIIRGVLFMDTIAMVIRNKDRNGYGINTFNIQVDADDLVDELSETNNSATVEYFIPLNSTRNLFPYNYSIVNTPKVDLSFQYTDLLGGPREYLLEIDTASTFDSGFKKQFVINAQVLGRMPFDLLMLDSVVYYWRTKISQPLENESKVWTVSSFAFINEGPEGWAQMQFSQFENNGTKGLVKDAVLKRINFQENISDLAIRTFTSASGKPRDSVSFKINQVEFNLMYEGGACRNNTFNMIAFDRRSTQPYAGLYFKWYEPGGRKLLCGREPYVINSFTPQELITGNQDDLAQYADNIAEGDSVVFFNIGDAGFEQWPEAARVRLADFGISAAQISGFKNGDAVVILGRKGSLPGTAHIHHASGPETVLEINKTIEGRFASGSMGSTLIGPAQQWDRFIPQVKEVEGVDGFSFTIMGVNAEGREDTLQTNIQSPFDLSAIKAADYPHLRVLFKTSDDINLTAVQLSKWLVLFEPVAEGLIYYNGPVSQETVAEGQVVSRDFGFINISNRAFSDDSLTVRYNLLNHSNPGGIAPTLKISAPAPGDTLLFTIPFQTLSKGGMNDMEVFVNPRIAREKIYDNNIMVLPEYLEVLTDQANPVVEVTFDGRFIRNDEYVSSSPSILIKLWDENGFMIKKDTLGMRIFIAHPCDTDACEFRPVYFSREDIAWTPASDTSDFKVHFS